ncbi:MAG: thiamine pyrophosphate-dependent dehydrogenase E1 component subunit alpha [Nitrospinota bacterium]
MTRGVEDRIRILYRQGKIAGGVYLSRGQEAISVGASYALAPQDVIAPSHRDMGAFLLRGITPGEAIAQYLGRATGPCRGKDGNIHMGDIRRGIIGFVSMLADNIPVAVGIALSFQIRRESRVAMAFFGDGATSRGDFHEGLNFAGVKRLPLVLICNNNQYAYSTPLKDQMAIEDIADRAATYGFPGQVVDGNDVIAVYEAARAAVDRARSGGGPTLIECKTFRMSGHSEHDDAFYVPKELFTEWEKRDPILLFERLLKERNLLGPQEKEAVEARIKKEIDDAVAFALESPLPAKEELLKDVYAEGS